MGGRGVAIGTDINGAAGLPCPRFGPFASYGVNEDDRRIAQRRGELERQTNGVAYNEPIRDYRWHRFESKLRRLQTKMRISGRPFPSTSQATTPGFTSIRKKISPNPL
jgi:hypothetical protein